MKKQGILITAFVLLTMLPLCFASANIDKDEHTLLLLHFDGDLRGVDGESPIQAIGATFENGLSGQGVLIDASDILTYSSSGNFNPVSGSVEFWVKPRWNGNDGTTRVFFSVGNEMMIVKDGANNLRFLFRTDDSEAFQAYNLNSWIANEWHHIAVTWEVPGKMNTFIDGIERISHTASIQDLISSVPPTVSIGSRNNSSQAEAVIDEFRISDIARSPAEIAQDILADTTVSSLTVEPFPKEMFITWQQTPKIIANTNAGMLNVPASAVTWSSSNTSIAAVDVSGKVTALTAGDVTITARIGSAESSASIKVKAPVRPPEHEPIDPFLVTPASGSLYVIPVVIMRYLPTTDGVNLDVSFNPDFGSLNPISLADLKRKIDTFDKRVKFMLEEGTKFRGYKDPSARSSIGYKVVDYITVYEPLPPGKANRTINEFPVYQPDYHQILDRFDGQNYVDNLGVKQFWLWDSDFDPSYPSYDPKIHKPENFRIGDESNMSSPTTGDISNSFRDNTDLPIYGRTYVLYGQNFRRTQAEAVHNRGHQLEAILGYSNQRQDGNTDLFWKKFVGNNNTNTAFVPGRCGDTHHPPNAENDYDYLNMRLIESDIEDWTPDGIGQKKQVNALTWGNIPYSWPDSTGQEQKTESQWYIYWMQNMPGRGNTIPFGLNRMTNWWAFTADWDASVRAGLGLYGSSGCTYSISAPSQSFDASGGTGNVSVFAGGCNWIAVSNANWISITSESTSANGNSMVSFLSHQTRAETHESERLP